MYYFLTKALKRRFLLELRRYWSYHPKYRDLPEFIQGKYSFKERPQRGIVLKTSSATHVSLAADNFVGTVESYVHLAKVADYPGLAVEWVREDARAIQENGGVFPSPPGIYYIDIVDNGQEFYVDPLLEVTDEPAMRLSSTEFQLENVPLQGTLRLFEVPGNLPLYEGDNYSVDEHGKITLTAPLSSHAALSADYKHPGESTGPWPLRENFAVNKPIPGAVLAFGRRVEGGDRLAVVVGDHRSPSALEYGGKWEISLDFDIISRDPDEQEEISDATVTYIWSALRSHLSTEGIEVTQVNMGGETEEVYDENADDYYYNASFSVSCTTDWSLRVPLSASIRRVVPHAHALSKEMAGLPDEELAAYGAERIFLAENYGPDLVSFSDPYFRDRTKTFERIK